MPVPTAPLRVSVVIPTWNEAAVIRETLADLATQGADEVVVADAASPDATAALAATAPGVRVLPSARGRGTQMNAGARATTGEALLFLHADCRLAPGAVAALRAFLERNPRIPGGCFRMRVAGSDPRYRLIDAAAHLRAGVLGLPYGDQGIFLRRAAFERLGGFPETPLMEDLLLACRLRQLGRVGMVACPIHVSDRRWRQRGILRQSFTNWCLTALAALGVPYDALARAYPALR